MQLAIKDGPFKKTVDGVGRGSRAQAKEKKKTVRIWSLEFK
jgi:hypothetical protein